MSKEQFITKKFRQATLEIIDQANTIISEYSEMGFSLTLRQLYYQFVARDIIPNKQTEYDRLGSIINDARLAGLIDWDAIEDRTRNLRKVSTWSSPEQIIDSVAYQYKEDLWEDQPFAPEVWIEKDALVGVIEPICKKLRVPFFACRGYTSASETYNAGKRFELAMGYDKMPIVFHLGDHDPSGLDMTRDNEDRLSLFANNDVEVRRLALNMDQVYQYNPPPNPAKQTDSRFERYSDKYGDQCWELDALNPPVIEALIDKAVKSIRVQSLWDEALDKEIVNKSRLMDVSERWTEIQDWLEE